MITDLLLRQTPEEALVTMINAENGTTFRPGVFHFSDVRQITGSLTEVRVTTRRSSADLDIVPAPGSFTFQFNRLDIGQHFAGVLGGFRPTIPTATQVLVDEITRRVGQLFYDDEFELDYIDRENSAPYVLRAKADSLRWFGSLSLELGDYVYLSTYLADATGATFAAVSEAPALAAQPISFSQINASENRALLAGFNVNDLAHDNLRVLNFVQHALPAPPSYTLGATVWNVSTTPGPFNLRNARVMDKTMLANPALHGNYANTNLQYMVWLQLDLAYCTNLSDRDVYIPYMADYGAFTDFTDQPRLRQQAVTSISNGSAYNVYLNTLIAPSIITTVPYGGMMLAGDVPWIADSLLKTPTNLYNGIVQYNGALRPVDMLPLTAGLNRVVVVTVNEPNNSAYRGNLAFYYRAPIIIDEQLPIAQVGYPFDFDFAPREGVAPYSLTRSAGTLPPGLSIVGTRLTGTPSVRGASAFSVAVTGSSGVTVHYQFRLNVLSD